MVDATRALLDELMGRDRDVPATQRSNKKVDFRDDAVCKYALVACCPHQLFVNTKSALGPCQGTIHEDHLDWETIKKDYEEVDAYEKDRLGYERELVRYMSILIRDMDRKIEKNRERAAAESAPRLLKADEQRRLDDIQGRMRESLDRSAQLGEEGKVDESLEAANMAESLKRQHDSLLRSLTAPERAMEVCDICGVFINSSDNEQRRLILDEIHSGKQYQGWKRIRETHAELTKAAEERRKAAADRPREERPRDERHGEERPRDRERDRERERPREDRYRERSPGRRRDYGGSSRDYGGGRDHYNRAPPPRDMYSRGRDRDFDSADRRRY